MMRRLPPAWMSRFGAVRFPAGLAETAPCDGVCLRDVIRRKADKSPELAVEPPEQRPALTATYEANPSPGKTDKPCFVSHSLLCYNEKFLPSFRG